MGRSSGQKLKLLYILDFLEKESSAEEPVTTKDIIDHLEKNGILAERKSIYDDIEKLIEYGIRIEKLSSRSGGGYYIAEREFELPELKLLVDAVQACRFIPQNMSRKLIGKLEKKAGEKNAKKLHRDVEIGSIRSKNDQIFRNIDGIHQGIQKDLQISFVYQDWNLDKKMTPKGENPRIVSPWKLIWHNEYYYLAAYDQKADKIKHYRVDKMDRVKVLEDLRREGLGQYRNINVSQYTNRTFGMFGGEEKKVTLNFPNSLIGVVFDRFGTEVGVAKKPDGTVNVHVEVVISGQFYGWLAGIGKEAKIISPLEVREDYRNYLKEILENGNP